MIYFLGDIHGVITDGLKKYLSVAKEDDLLIILGDVGLNFYGTKENDIFDKDFLAVDKKIAFLDGNHENFPYINSFPIEAWNGGRVHRINENIVHLMRSEIYNIEDNTFLTVGGCVSSVKWQREGPWYPEEVPAPEEIEKAYQNLEKHNNTVDYILTHKYETVEAERNTLEGMTQFIDKNVDFKRWYSGHWHDDMDIDDRHKVVYDNLVSL